MRCVQSRELDARARLAFQHLSCWDFIDTLLVLLILHIVYDCHLQAVLQS